MQVKQSFCWHATYEGFKVKSRDCKRFEPVEDRPEVHIGLLHHSSCGLILVS